MKVGDKMVISKDEDIERTSRSLKAMSHPLRLKILCTLGEEEISVQDIAEFVGTSQSNISQHLAILRDKGILTSRKEANRVFYRVGDSRTLRLLGMMREVFCNRT
ncbi:MAG: ArsR family transcriptional regulator [Gammaproteobacteria bacterium]|nr:MAG: ArsR family transcriptional regulator [Gammaproteobacteria bacterium]